MKNLKKMAILLVLAAMTCVLLTGCDSQFHGTWKSVKVEEGGKTYDKDDEEMGGFVKSFMEIEIEKGGEGKITISGESKNLEWKADGDSITLTVDGDDEEGELKDDQLIIEEDDFKVYLEKDD